jgi:hypothetical protein
MNTRCASRRLLALIALGLAAASFVCAAEPKWISLFDGQTLSGWKLGQGHAKVEVRDGAIVGYVTKGETQNTFLVTEDDTFTDFVFECEFRCDPDINSGVNFRSRPADASVKRLYGPQYEIDPTARALTGGVQEEGGSVRRDSSKAGTNPTSFWLAPTKSSGAPQAEWLKLHGDQFKPAPAWNTCRIECRGTHITTWLNGHLLADFDDKSEVRIPRGFFGLQIHATKEEKLFGREVAFRNLRVQRLD